MTVTALPGTQWPDPDPLDIPVEPPPFPTDSLPTWLARQIRAEATATQVPEDMAGMLVLAALSTAVQGKINAVANNNTWSEPVTLYTATAMTPGQRKSAIFERINRPLLEWEAQIQEFEWPEVSRSQQEYKELEQAIEKADAEVQKRRKAWSEARRSNDYTPDQIRALEGDLTTAREEATDLRVAFNQMKPRVKTRLVYNDLTPEAAQTELSQQPGERISIISDEGGVFEVLTGSRYNDRLNLDLFLKGHSGNLIVVDRIGRESERINRPMVTLGLAIQPNVLQEIGKSRQMHGRGLLARFLYSVPDSPLGERLIDAPEVPEEIRAGFDEGIKAICASAYGAQGIHRVFLSDEAQSIFWGYQQQLEPRLKPEEGDLDQIVEWASKLAGAVLRIATLIATAREQRMPEIIDEDDIRLAINFSDYFIAHAWRAFGLMGLVESAEHEARIVRKIKRARLAEFTSRELYRSMNMSRHMTADVFEETLETLSRLNYLRRIVDSQKPPRHHWTVNPQIHEE